MTKSPTSSSASSIFPAAEILSYGAPSSKSPSMTPSTTLIPSVLPSTLPSDDISGMPSMMPSKSAIEIRKEDSISAIVIPVPILGGGDEMTGSKADILSSKYPSMSPSITIQPSSIPSTLPSDSASDMPSMMPSTTTNVNRNEDYGSSVIVPISTLGGDNKCGKAAKGEKRTSPGASIPVIGGQNAGKVNTTRSESRLQ